MKKRPNIIIFNPDEMRADALGHLGNPALVTPNLDAFAKSSAVSFSHAYCQNPVCVPSRCSFFTGLYPHVHGHRTMGYLLHPGESSLFSELKAAGYYVWMNDRNDLLAGQIPGWMQSHASEIFYTPPVLNTRAENPALFREPGGKYYYSHFQGRLSLNEEGVCINKDDLAVNAAIQKIHEHPKDQPLCLFLGLIYPHPPYGVEEPYYSLVDRAKLPRRIRQDECSGKAKILSEIKRYTGMEEFTEDDWNELRAAYLGMCRKIDVQFGKILDALRQEDMYDDSAIFFLSDHGDFTGDYDLPEKAQNSFEECLTRVPFLIKPPAEDPLDPGVSDSLTELIDFYATAMDFAGVTPDHTQFGKSLRPVLSDRTKEIRDFVFCEGGRQPGEVHCDEYHANGGPKASAYWPKMMAQTDDEAHAKGIMIRGKDYKYISRTLGRDELYDLSLDPCEKVNRIDDPAYQDIVVKMEQALLKWLQATDDVVPLSIDQRFSAEMIWNKVKDSIPPGKEEEVQSMINKGMSLPSIIAHLAPSLQQKRGSDQS